MTDEAIEPTVVHIYLRKAEESLTGAASEFVNGRYQNAANRAYAACFQAAIAALMQEDILPPHGRWDHAFVQEAFVGNLINQRNRYPVDLRETLSRNLILRHTADHAPLYVTEVQAYRAVRRARAFLVAVQQKGGGRS